MTPQWIEYDGSDKQIEEIDSGDNDILFRLGNGKVILDSEVNGYWREPFIGVTDYLICQPHPYADLIKIWADTGCPVWWRMIPSNHIGLICKVYETTKPDWHIPGAEYRLTPFED